MVKVPPLAVPQLGSCASSGRAWRLWAARHSQEEASPLDAQPPLRDSLHFRKWDPAIVTLTLTLILTLTLTLALAPTLTLTLTLTLTRWDPAIAEIVQAPGGPFAKASEK